MAPRRTPRTRRTPRPQSAPRTPRPRRTPRTAGRPREGSRSEPPEDREREQRIGLHSLAPAPGSRRPRKRVGRGEGSGTGKTAGRGQKGDGSRSGAKSRARFEGGQMPIHMRMRKLRGPHMKKSMPFEPFRTHTQAVNIGDLEDRFDAGSEVTLESMRAKGLGTRKAHCGQGARQGRAQQGPHRARPRLQRHRPRAHRGRRWQLRRTRRAGELLETFWEYLRAGRERGLESRQCSPPSSTPSRFRTSGRRSASRRRCC